MCGHCKAEDAVVCEECGALVAFEYQPTHRRQHPHPFEADDNGDCLTCWATDVHLVHRVEDGGDIPPPVTPVQAHARREQADRDRDQFAWLHQCGHLNRGYWHKRSMCGGCRFSVERAGEVEAHYRLVPVEGLPGDHD